MMTENRAQKLIRGWQHSRPTKAAKTIVWSSRRGMSDHEEAEAASKPLPSQGLHETGSLRRAKGLKMDTVVAVLTRQDAQLKEVTSHAELCPSNANGHDR